ncbi:hypothetical protein Asphe3_38270 [Pseudarthrobacter phenanthrenivorans Sphe3]|uniref:Uncharacterized protein n=1 Tax=Pseudarthrobacter phenanthrenivorans (strain DSM 18606 / JCM 16027 / LMG 23796 / Sphe3) TaxID=930171 RepID=F0M8J7_PSEPM|nr:hypothetical protein [Pseudarthrobacter phenanthrenivorans]ADX74915.1 hypothetical protein Asphe3_38270 [Pseudarthrobacter phenanthrenivorans Sphe3]
MDQKTLSALPKTTLRAGIIIGAAGAFAVILAPQILQSLQLGPSYSQAMAALLNMVFQLVTLFFLPFSAALIAGSLVMRYVGSVLTGTAAAGPVK